MEQGTGVNLERIRALCQNNNIQWTQHALQRILKRGISQDEVIKALMTGEIIEDYPDDYPNPSGLILGGNKLHVVCGVDDDRLWIITAYRPNPDKWENDLKTRKKGAE